MNISLSFSILSLFYAILIAIIYFSKKKVKNVETQIYSILIVTNLVGLTTELFSTYLNTRVEEFTFIKSLSLKLIVAYFFTWMYFFSTYIYYISTKKYDTKRKTINIISYITLLIFMMLLPLYTKIEDGIIKYTYGPQVNFLYVTFFILLSFWTILIIKNIKTLEKKKLIPLVVFIFLEILVAIIQTINPELLILGSLLVFVTQLMYFTIENPDVKMIEQLEVAKDTADKANRAKTDFLSSMSHEIRTPLNAIVGFSDCIIDANTIEEAKENAKDIVNASETLLEIVNGILDISKIEAGKLEIVNSNYNAKDLFLELAKLIKPRMDDKALDFSYYIAPDIPDVLYGDHANLKKIVTNLLSNASKYTDKGYVRYEVNCVKTETTCKLIISVTDSGRGIKKESIDKLFTKFQRLEEDRNTTIEGTGLGLAITKQLIELMGGKIIVHTIYGEGSKFTVVLNQRIEKVNIETPKEIKNDTLDLKNIKLLLVDDNVLNLKVATKLLEKYNAKTENIETVDNGFDCINNINMGKTYDVILLDDMMPKMSGIETLKKLKEINGFNIPVVALTANAITGMREKYLNNGFDDYLAKPIEKEQLITVLNNVLRKENLEEEKIINKENNMIEDNIEELEMENEVNQTNTNYDEQYLRNNGIDMDNALNLLGDMEMYNDTLKDYLNEVDNKLNELKKYKEENDMANYSVLVHSMKSDAKYLGFMQFADIAYQHELKSKENDSSFVNENFNKLEEELNKVLTIVKEYAKNIS